MAKARRGCRVPLETVVMGQGGLKGWSTSILLKISTHLGDYSTLGELMDDLRIGCPTEIMEWGTENEIANVWSMIGAPGSISANGNPMVVYQLDSTAHFHCHTRSR